MYSTGGTSVTILPHKDLADQGYTNFCAHNLKINIIGNRFLRAKSEGLAIINLAIASIDISGNEFNTSSLHNIYIKQLH